MTFDELKERQSVAWGAGAFERIAATIADIHDRVFEKLDPQPGERFLDVACGTGAVAERAAGAGAVVTGIDFAPALIETAKRLAAERGIQIDYSVGDAERLDLPDAAFDVVASTFGVMFAPDHEAAAHELARVVRPGGRIGLTTWEPGGGIDELFKMMAPFQPPPPPGAGNPLDWGSEEHVGELLGDEFDLDIEHAVSTYRIGSGEEYWQLFSTSFGPVKTLADSLGDRREEFHRAWVDFFESNYGDDGGIAHEREYLLVLGTRR